MKNRQKAFRSMFGREFAVLAAIVALGTLVAALPPSGFAKTQQTFSSPEAASSALFAAAKDGNEDALMRILGTGKELVALKDEAADRLERERFVIKYREMHRFVQEDGRTTVLYIGAENWPFPIPLRSKKAGWYFDSDSGAKEVMLRRIGMNENAVIEADHLLVLAQRAYRSTLHSDDTTSHYAPRFVSTQGKEDGLYSGADSPIPDFVANAGVDSSPQDSNPVPYAGYYFRILTQQGKAATGGPLDYFSGGELTGGFAFVAYPAKYGSSGVMTFIVNQDDVVYAKDLGPNSAKTAQAMTSFNPDRSWHVAE